MLFPDLAPAELGTSERELMNLVDYLPYEQRKPDWQYQNFLRYILEHGYGGPTRQGVPVWTILGQTMHFPFANGFPMITERSIRRFWRKPINELGVFINGGRNKMDLEAAGVTWWGEWTSLAKTEKRGLAAGDIGPGSYGAAFHDFPMPNGGGFDQWAAVIEQFKTYPHERRHLVSPWVPYFVYRTKENPNSDVTIAPCHGWVYLRMLEDRIHLVHIQRSCDMPVGVPSNMVQYAALALFVGHLMQLPVEQYVHMFVDAHIYINQKENVETILEREPRAYPTLVLNEKGLAATDIHEFSGDLFDLSDYHPHPAINGIPVAT